MTMTHRLFLHALRALPVALALAGLPLAASAQDTARAAMQTGPQVTAGDLVISGGFSRATLPNAPVGGGYMTITNTGQSDDKLVSASTPVAGSVEIHRMTMVGDVMTMRQLMGGLPIPAGQTVTLKPGGYHLMFIGLTQRLTQGTTIKVKLTFAKAGTVEVPLVVGPINAGASNAMGGQMNGQMNGMKHDTGGQGTMDDSTKGNRLDNNMVRPADPGAAPSSMG